ESPAFRILTVKDGLPSTSVTQIAEDRQGYLWIGTTDGLARYDGVEFRVWRFDPQREDSLLGNTVTVLHIDEQDRIWVGTPQGLSVMGPERQGFQRYSNATHKEISF